MALSGGCKAVDDVVFGLSVLVTGEMFDVALVDDGVGVSVVTVWINVLEGFFSASRMLVLCLVREDLDRS